MFSGGVFPGVLPLCFQEVDAGMKDRHENTLFLGSVPNKSVLLPMDNA